MVETLQPGLPALAEQQPEPSQSILLMHTTKSQYRPEIDGLRAFAVISVIINHFNRNLLPSGYLGVDIFFVISGYVITSSLSGRESKNFGDYLSGFYERRIKRLVPALAAFVLVLSGLICLFNPDPNSALTSGIASLFGVSNLYFYKQSLNYFAQSTELNPFTHTWSLGVEEQFYLVFPFLIWFSGFGRHSKNGARNLFVTIGLLTAASLVAFVYLYQANQASAYFLMPARFWEMAAGCLAFLGFKKRARLEQTLEKLPPLLILAFMVGVMYSPIKFAVVATISMVVLSAIFIACLKNGTAAYSVFTQRHIVYVGVISYSLYLWHWGVLSISRWTIGVHWWSAPVQLFIIFIISALSYNYVESKLRKASWSRTRVISIISGFSILILSTVAIAILKLNTGRLYLGMNSKSINDEQHGSLSTSKCAAAWSRNPSLNRLIPECSLKPRQARSIIAVGDSQMDHLVPLLQKINKQDGFGIMYYSQLGNNFPSLIESRSTGESVDKVKKSYLIPRNAFDFYFSKARQGDVILLSSRYELRWGKYPVPYSQRQLKFSYYSPTGQILPRNLAYYQWQQLFHDLIKKAAEKDIRVVIFNSIPTFEDELDPSLANPQWFNSFSRNSKDHHYLPRSDLKQHYQQVDTFFESLEEKYPNVHVFDAFGALCPPSMQICTPTSYRDQWHLSRTGAKSLYPQFKMLINKIIPATQS